MAFKKISKKILRFTGIILGIILLLAISFHLWFIYHSKGLLETMVENRSDGNLKLQIQKLSYNYFTRKMRITRAVFYSADSTTISTGYHFYVRKVTLKLKALIPFLTEKKLLIEYMDLITPEIQVTKLRENTDTSTENKKLSIPYEMGKVYKSIQSVLQSLEVERFQLYNGKFTLSDKTDPDQHPVIISNIDMHIDNLQFDSSNVIAKRKILFSDNIVIHTHNQRITLPDGRHHLNFNNFNINLRNQLVEFDSCTISGDRTDNTKTSFSVFFDKLRLSNVDFDTLYRNDVIKADTVFCMSPRFTLIADISNRKDSTKTGPRLEKIIQQLTGDLLIANVIVKDASFDINTIRNGIPNSFTSSQNNFEMEGLQINQDAENPVHVENFTMAIRNYENFIKDSSYRVKFDSVLFREDQIYLSNFLFNKLNNNKIVYTFRIPQFYLGGLSWDDLVFEKKLKAEQATLFNPYIDYTVSGTDNKKKGKKNIFKSLAAINDYMDLDYLDIQNGDINFKLNENLNLKLNNATLSIKSSALLNSTDLAGLKNSLSNLNFKKGTIHTGNLDMKLSNIYFNNQKGQLSADSIDIRSKNNDLVFALQQAGIRQLEVDEKTGDIIAEGITWKKGNIDIIQNKAGSGDLRSILELKNFSGEQTGLTIRGTDLLVSSHLNQLSFDKLEKVPGRKLETEGLVANGKQLIIQNKDISIAADQYNIADNKFSTFTNFRLQKVNPSIRTDIKSIRVNVIPHINSFISGSNQADSLSLEQPVISIEIKDDHKNPGQNHSNLTTLDISSIRLNNPDINFTRKNDIRQVSFLWNGTKNLKDEMILNNFRISNDSIFNTSLQDAVLHMSNFSYTGPGGKRFNSGEAEFSTAVKNIQAAKDKENEWHWQGFLNNIDGKNLVVDSAGNKKGRLTLNVFNIKGLVVNSGNSKNIKNIISDNSLMRISNVTGSYSDSRSIIHWYNAFLDKLNGSFTLDSFSYSPALEKELFIASQPYQTDYITLTTGNIHIKDFDVNNYLNNQLLKMNSIKINELIFNDFRDRRVPRKPAEIKLLPVAKIKNSSVRTLIGNVSLLNSSVIYAELNEKTGQTGVIPVSNLNVNFSNIKNTGIAPDDSLYISATGYLMDSIATRLNFNQSYADSLQGFSLTARLGAAKPAIMNPVLKALASVKIKSGNLDTIDMKVKGNDSYGYGDMLVKYNNLRISVLGNNDVKKTLKSRLINFFANTFIIKNKNISKRSTVYFERLRDRSVLNYIVKLFFSGISTSTGIDNDKKVRKAYQKKWKNHVF